MLPTINNKLLPLMVVAYCLQQSHLVSPSLQTSTFKYSPSSYFQILVATFLCQPMISYYKGYQLICNLDPFCRRNAKLLRKTHDIIFKNYTIFHIFLKKMHTKHLEILQPFSTKTSHKYKYISHYSLLVLHHTFLQESPLFQHPTTNVSNAIKIL